MAVEVTPLGFQKPDGNDAARNGDNVIAANAAKSEELLGNALPRLSKLEASTTGVLAELEATTSGRLDNLEESTLVRLNSLESAAFVGGGLLVEDPTDPGFYIVGGQP